MTELVGLTLPFRVMKTSLIGRPFVLGFPILLLVLAVVAWRRAHRMPQRIEAGVVSVVGSVLVVAVVVNGYFAYVPSVGALVGRRATYELSAAAVAAQLDASTIPAHGGVIRVHIPGAASGFHARSAQISLPPALFAHPRPALPAIELLHGTPGTPEDWTRAGFADVTAERWAAGHGGVAPVIVMPDPNGGFTADTECLDSHPGKAETYLVRDVPEWVMTHEGVSGPWAIAGSSEGGYCAAVLGLRHPDRYRAFADFSGLDRPTHSRGMRWLLGPRASVSDYTPRDLLGHGPAPAAWFEVGGADGGTHRAVVRLAASAKDAGLDTELVVLPGAHHTWRVWRRSFEDSLPWLLDRLSAGR